MKVKIDHPSILFAIAVVAVGLLASCAGMETSNTKSLLGSAGFRAQTPQTKAQQEIYAALPNNRVEHTTVKGKGYYVFKDQAAGVVYVGGQSEYQRYQQLCAQQHATAAQEEEMSHPLAKQWNHWGPAHS
jgi:hypothetical protein